jgi:hypothetical protein
MAILPFPTLRSKFDAERFSPARARRTRLVACQSIVSSTCREQRTRRRHSLEYPPTVLVRLLPSLRTPDAENSLVVSSSNFFALAYTRRRSAQVPRWSTLVNAASDSRARPRRLPRSGRSRTRKRSPSRDPKNSSRDGTRSEGKGRICPDIPHGADTAYVSPLQQDGPTKVRPTSATRCSREETDVHSLSAATPLWV